MTAGRADRKPPRVLFVDDEPDIVAAITLSLEMMAWEVAGFTSPGAALRRFEADPDAFDCVITDYTLPEMACAEFIARLRAIRPGLSIHLCTGNAEHEIQEAAAQLGVQHILYKPFDFQELDRFLSGLSGAEG